MSNINNKPTAHIENWSRFGDGLIGTVQQHHRQNEFHSTVQRTSGIVRMSLLDGWAETQNTYYTLGAQANV